MTVRTQDVPDHLRPGLKLVIVGINPGGRSGATGHHYAWPGNHFWPVLFEAGIITEPLTFAEDSRVLEWDIGLTNLCERTTRSADELTRARARGRRGQPAPEAPAPAATGGLLQRQEHLPGVCRPQKS